MCRKLFCLGAVVLVLSLAGIASAAVPEGWTSLDIAATGGGAEEVDGTWTVTGEGADIWGSSDAFQFAYVELAGNVQIIAHVADNGTGSNAWAKGGVMIRQSLEAGSTHSLMAITGGNGGGGAFQWRPVADAGSSSAHTDSAGMAPGYWVKLVRVGNAFSGSFSADGETWTQQGEAQSIDMTSDVYVGLCVTSHAAGELRTYTLDNVSIELLANTAVGPIPADGAVDADVAALEWGAGTTAVSHKVYLSSDDTIDDADLVGETELTIQVAILDPGATYYWRVDEVEAAGNVIEGDVWSFSTLPLEAHFPSPEDGAVWQALDAQLSWAPGKNVVMHDVYLSTDEAVVAAADMSTFKGKVFTTSFDPGALAPDTVYYWRVDEFSPTGTNAGPVWSFTTFDPEVASDPAPADGDVDVSSMPTLGWAADESATQDVYLGTDEALVAAGDASVLVSQQTGTGVAVADALDRGTTLYWKVDVTTADGKVHLGFVNSFRVADQNTDNWAIAIASVGPAYVDTYVQDGLYDIGALSGDITYEFIVKSNLDETEASMALIGRRNFGDTQVGLKYEQWNNTGTYGATVFGVLDYDYGVATAPGEYTHLVFVSSEDAAATELYVNGVLEGSIASAITLSGLVGIGYGAQGEDASGSFDNFDGDIFGVAIYDRALTADEIISNGDKYFSPIPITDPDLLIYYDFESGAGGTAIDQSGHSNHGQFMGTPEWATGPFGGAVSIVKDDVDYIQTAAPLGITSNTISVTGWVYHDESPTGWSGILTTRGSGNLGLQHDGTELRYMWGADQYWDFSSGLNIPNGEWYFAALTISPDQGKLYLNGVAQTATNVAPHDPVDFDDLIRVGRDHNDDRIMTSLIDEVRLYNKTLTDVDIQGMLLSDVTGPGDVVKGVPDEARDGSAAGWPDGEFPGLAVDDDTSTKFLHFRGEVSPTGIVVEPAMGLTVVTGLTLTSANDSPNRDPASFELSGSNDSIDGPYELIAAGDVADFTQADEWPRFTKNATAISFENEIAYKYYQVMFPTVRDAGTANSMQIAEVELLGVAAYDNILANGGFEDGIADPWNTYGDATLEVVQELVGAAVPEAPVEGSSCLHVTVGSAGANFWDAGLQHGGHVFEVGKSYTLSVWFKSKSGTFDINIKPERAASPWDGFGSQAITITEEWAEYTVNTGVIADADVEPASITFHIAYAPGEFWVDNAVFYED